MTNSLELFMTALVSFRSCKGHKIAGVLRNDHDIGRPDRVNANREIRDKHGFHAFFLVRNLVAMQKMMGVFL